MSKFKFLSFTPLGAIAKNTKLVLDTVKAKREGEDVNLSSVIAGGYKNAKDSNLLAFYQQQKKEKEMDPFQMLAGVQSAQAYAEQSSGPYQSGAFDSVSVGGTSQDSSTKKKWNIAGFFDKLGGGLQKTGQGITNIQDKVKGFQLPTLKTDVAVDNKSWLILGIGVIAVLLITKKVKI